MTALRKYDWTMYNKAITDEAYAERIKEHIQKNYSLTIDGIFPGQRGSYGETWCIIADQRKYFVKIHFLTSILDNYRNSLTILEHINKDGLDFAHRVIPTKEGKLWDEFDTGLLAVFSYVDGLKRERSEVSMAEIYRLLGKLYNVSTSGLQLEKEYFSVEPADKTIEKVKEYPVLHIYRDRLNGYRDLLLEASDKCKGLKDDMVITHGDIGNNIIESDGRLFVVDWDTAKTAYPERDIWFMVKTYEELSFAKESLKKNGVKTPIRKDRLLYYGVYGFFFHFWNHVVSMEEATDDRKKRLICNYMRRYFFNAFINEQIDFLKTV